MAATLWAGATGWRGFAGGVACGLFDLGRRMLPVLALPIHPSCPLQRLLRQTLGSRLTR
jgi:hypothetical protein